MSLQKDLTRLVEAGIIDQDTSARIETYYRDQPATGTPVSKLVIAFGILGSLLVGLGIVLILAHNWDNISREIKTVIAFVPLLIGQGICGYTLWKQNNSTAWREAGSVFLVLAIGTCISLISQIYNIPGNVSSFLLTWVLLALPVVYIMRSSMAALLYIAGITYYGCEMGYGGGLHAESYTFWGLLLLVIPHYVMVYRKNPDSNFLTFLNWCIPLSVIIMLGTVATQFEEMMFIAYMSLFGSLYLLGHTSYLREQKVRNNGYLVLGSLGTVVLLLGLSFDWFWENLRDKTWGETGWMSFPESWAALILTLLALVLLILQKKDQKPLRIHPVELMFLIFIGVFIMGLSSSWAVLLINMMILAIGVLTIQEGARHNHFGILNYGLLILTALIICRFFDTDLSFVLRGVLFVAVGIGFFVMNYRMLKKGKDKPATPGLTQTTEPNQPKS